ncbi:MAG: hypothetical protein NUW21_12020 [Elusimicrobia bacterium]|nr:hypothetical protein [Elusimicrobiota bacterium]
MKALALVLLLAGPVLAADDGPDEETRVKIAEYMLKTPLDEANPTLVSGFMKLDTATLPKKLREKSRARQMEIDAVVKIHKGKKKGPFRFPETCTPKVYKGAEGLRAMQMIHGNGEIEGDEKDYIERKTNCTEEQLMCEFSLNIVVIMRPGKPPLQRFFLMDMDPLMALVAEKRGGGASTGKYFQEMKPSCQKNASEQ